MPIGMRVRAWLLALVATVLVTLGGGASATAADEPSYVALGDSFTADP